MFELQTMKSKVNNYNLIPRGILSLALLVALTVLAGGVFRQSSAQEPSPRKVVEPRVVVAPRVEVKPVPKVYVDLSDVDSMDFSYLDKMDFSFIDKMDFSFLDKMDFSYLDKMDFSDLDKMDLPSFDKFGKLTQQGRAAGVGSGVGSGVSQAEEDSCEFKIEVLQALLRNDAQRGIVVATDWLKPGSPQTVPCKRA